MPVTEILRAASALEVCSVQEQAQHGWAGKLQGEGQHGWSWVSDGRRNSFCGLNTASHAGEASQAKRESLLFVVFLCGHMKSKMGKLLELLCET